MKPICHLAVRVLYCAVATSLALTSPTAWSQQSDDDSLIEEIVTTGTRREGQSPTETLSPIDVLAGTALTDQATFDMTDGLTKIAPSLNT
jgi:iron complex outermembrane receptor protein